MKMVYRRKKYAAAQSYKYRKVSKKQAEDAPARQRGLNK
jgi:hypothetical protein